MVVRIRRRCGGCGILYHIPNTVMKMLRKQHLNPECPICGSTLSVKAVSVKKVGDQRDAPIQSYF